MTPRSVTAHGAAQQKPSAAAKPLKPIYTKAFEFSDCWVNDARRQSSNTRQLIFTVPEIIAFASSVMTLLPGDVIATGTPSGVGPLADGDRVTVKVQGIGELRNTVSSRE